MAVNDAVEAARKMGKSDATGKTSSGVSMFTTTINDTIATVDGYKRGVVSTLLSMKDGLLESIAKAKDWLLNVPIGPFGNIQEIMKKVVVIKDDINRFRKEVGGAIQGAIGVINGISDEVMSNAQEIMRNIEKYTSEDYWMNEVLGDVTRKYNDLVSQVNSVVLENQNKIERLQNKMEQMAIDLGLMKDAAGIGANGIVDSIMNKYPNENNAKEVLGSALPTAIMNGDLDMVDNIIKWCSPEYVLMVFPDCVRMIMMNFRYKPGTKVNDYPAEADHLVKTLESLDPNWDKYRWGINDEHNLSLFTLASVDCKSAFSFRPPYDRVVKVAERHPQGRTLQQIAKEMYPGIAM